MPIPIGTLGDIVQLFCNTFSHFLSSNSSLAIAAVPTQSLRLVDPTGVLLESVSEPIKVNK